MSSEIDFRLAKRNDPRPTQELIRLALTAADEQAAWEPVSVLHYRGNREVLEAARALCHSDIPRERRLGADILGQLGVPGRAFPEECFNLLAEMLKNESEPEVIGAIGVAFWHLQDARAINLLIPLKNHQSADVRYGVVLGLSGYENASAIATLIELTNDTDDEVRNWATFAIGSYIKTDTVEIRDALHARTSDVHEETRGEALVGLTTRLDGRVIEPLIRELASKNVGRLPVEAAEAMGDPRLYPALWNLKTWWAADESDAELLDDALARCRPRSE
jgi:HEAT repeat protein